MWGIFHIWLKQDKTKTVFQKIFKNSCFLKNYLAYVQIDIRLLLLNKALFFILSTLSTKN